MLRDRRVLGQRKRRSSVTSATSTGRYTRRCKYESETGSCPGNELLGNWLGRTPGLVPVRPEPGAAVPKAIERVGDKIVLPEAAHDSHTSVERALLERRSVRQYRDEPISVADLSQLLWAAQGVTQASGLRTAPSAGALYPLEVYAVVGTVDGLPAGIYRYDPQAHDLTRTVTGDRRAALSQASAGPGRGARCRRRDRALGNL